MRLLSQELKGEYRLTGKASKAKPNFYKKQNAFLREIDRILDASRYWGFERWELMVYILRKLDYEIEVSKNGKKIYLKKIKPNTKGWI